MIKSQLSFFLIVTMQRLKVIETFSQIKLLADARRSEIMRLLMASPATLTQLAFRLEQSPAWVRHHLKALESVGLVNLSEIRKHGKITERYYRASAGAFLLQQLLLPESPKTILVFCGSDDLALEIAAKHLEKYIELLYLPVGSLNGLMYLRQGLCQISGTHILEPDGKYNLSTVQYIFPDRPMALITLAHRTQGLLIAAGNPKGIRKLGDLCRPTTRLINRNSGSGTRLWLDRELKRLGLSPQDINGYAQCVSTHGEAATHVATGQADVAIGLEAAAQRHGLDFIPLFEERYDLIFPRLQEEKLKPLLDYLQ
ncbi:MAG: substrate-binding domain-containing protein, partial [Anaerolineales bacterium]